MKRLALLLLWVACGGDPDPHVLGTCQGWTDNQGNPFTGQCEEACKSPPQSTGMTCDTKVQLNCAAFNYTDDVRGCCIPDTSGSPIRFVECA